MLAIDHAPARRSTQRALRPIVRSFADDCWTLASALPRVELLEESPDAKSIAAWIGLAQTAYVALDARVGDQPTTIICVPRRTWDAAADMELVMSLKHLLALLDRRVVLVPERWIRRQPRLGNAQLLASSSDARITASERMRVLALLLEEDATSLLDLATLVSSDDPVSSILRLVHEGYLEIDLERTILPSSLVRLAQPVTR